MEDANPPGVAQPADDDAITTAPPLPPEQQENQGNEGSEGDQNVYIPLIELPGLPRQTVDVPTAQDASRPTTPPPLEDLLPPLFGYQPLPSGTTADSSGTIPVQGAGDPTQGERKRNWWSLKFFVSFWQKKPRQPRPQEPPRENRRGWRRVRGLFTREPPPTAAQTSGNEAQQTHSPSVTDGGANSDTVGEANNTEERGRTGERRTSSRTVRRAAYRRVRHKRRQAAKPSAHRPPGEPEPLKEIDEILEGHRSKLSAGHQGQLREPPNPNDPNTPPKPMPKVGALVNRRKPPPPPPQPPPAYSQLVGSSRGSSTSRVLPSSSPAHYLSDPDDFYGGPFFSHSEEITSKPVEHQADSTSTEYEQDDPRGPQNSPEFSITTDGRYAQTTRSYNASPLSAEIRYPSQSPPGTPERRSSSVETGDDFSDIRSMEADQDLSPEEECRIRRAVISMFNPFYLRIPRPFGPAPQAAKFAGPYVSLQEISPGDDEISNSSEQSSSDDVGPVLLAHDTTFLECRSRCRLDAIDELFEDAEAEWCGLDPLLNVDCPIISSYSDVSTESSWVALSSEEGFGDDYKAPMWGDKAKDIDIAVHSNYDSYNGYTRGRTNNDPGLAPGPSNWRERPRIGDMSLRYEEEGVD